VLVERKVAVAVAFVEFAAEAKTRIRCQLEAAAGFLRRCEARHCRHASSEDDRCAHARRELQAHAATA
jgi:hypothetical protein